jgi:hypothetical protein
MHTVAALSRLSRTLADSKLIIETAVRALSSPDRHGVLPHLGDMWISAFNTNPAKSPVPNQRPGRSGGVAVADAKYRHGDSLVHDSSSST